MYVGMWVWFVNKAFQLKYTAQLIPPKTSYPACVSDYCQEDEAQNHRMFKFRKRALSGKEHY